MQCISVFSVVTVLLSVFTHIELEGNKWRNVLEEQQFRRFCASAIPPQSPYFLSKKKVIFPKSYSICPCGPLHARKVTLLTPLHSQSCSLSSKLLRSSSASIILAALPSFRSGTLASFDPSRSFFRTIDGLHLAIDQSDFTRNIVLDFLLMTICFFSAPRPPGSELPSWTAIPVSSEYIQDPDTQQLRLQPCHLRRPSCHKILAFSMAFLHSKWQLNNSSSGASQMPW